MAMNTAALNTVYNHFLTTYAPKGINSQYDTHKKSELRSIYNSIVKLNKEAPLAILDTSRESQKFAVGMKENARALHNTIVSVSGDDPESLVNKKMAYSSNEAIASAAYIGSGSAGEVVPSFSLEVNALASPQVNTGNFLPDEPVDLTADAYSFDISINDLNYEFQFNVSETDTNRSVQERLARLVNNSSIGLEASVLDDEEGNSALQLSSRTTGLVEGKYTLFRVSDNNTSRNAGTVDYFGIGQMTRASANAEFLINGNERTALSNNFTIEKFYEINLTGLSIAEGDVTNIGLKPDHESLKENITSLIGGYNDFLRAANEYTPSQPKSGRLINEMSGIASLYQQSLEQLGISVSDSGTLEVNDGVLENVVSEDDAAEILAPIKSFTNALLRKTGTISLNPMNYVNKTIVAYKNPGHEFASPYVTSAYSGMMFNSYC